MGVLGDGFYRDPAHLIQSIAAENGTRPAEKRGIPKVVCVLNDSVEEFAFAGDAAEIAEVLFKGICGVKVMRRLQHAQLRVALEPAAGDLEEGASRHVIAVKDGDEVGGGLCERVIDVARLRMVMLGTSDVADTCFLGELAYL